jgi:hypothetical protein
MDLGSKQPLSEISKRNISLRVKEAGILGLPYHLHVDIVWKLGPSASWNPQGLPRSVLRLLYLLHEISEMYIYTSNVINISFIGLILTRFGRMLRHFRRIKNRSLYCFTTSNKAKVNIKPCNLGKKLTQFKSRIRTWNYIRWWYKENV